MNTIEQLYLLFEKYNTVFTDSRKACNGGLFFALKGEHFDANDFALKAIADGADYAIVDRKSLENEEKCFYVENTLIALQQLANFYRRKLNIPFLAVTGTNGKTTTKELITAILSQNYNVLSTKGNFNNHIGVPLTILSIKKEHEFAVVEMGANHPGEIDFLCNIVEPDYGIITNVGKAHLEGFGSFEGVKQTKSELYRFIAAKGKAIFLNLGNEYLKPLASSNETVFTYSVNGINSELTGELANHDLFVNAKILFEKGWLYINSRLTGAYNLENIIAAARIGVQFGVNPLLIKKGIEEYTPSNNRSQILKKNTNTFIVDCYNANPSSMDVAITNFVNIDKKGKVLVLGDMLELGEDAFSEHQKLVDRIQTEDIEEVILVGNEFLKTNVDNRIKRFKNIDDFINSRITVAWTNKFILIKGSRGIKLEQVVDKV